MFHRDGPGTPLPYPPTPFGLRGTCPVPPPGVFPSAETRYLHGNYSSPHCSNFSIDRSTVIALGGSQQIVPPTEISHPHVPQWISGPAEQRIPDNSDKAGEEFLRCLATNEPFPDYLKGDLAYNLADALKSASILKETIKLEQNQRKKSGKSRSRSRGRSRGKRSRSRGKSRAKSRARSRSRRRSKSRARGKSRARSRNRSRSNSWSPSRSKKSSARSKSQIRRSSSHSSSQETSHGKEQRNSANNLPGKSLLEELKLVMASKEMEAQLPSLKESKLNIQASGEGKKVSRGDAHQKKDHQDDSASEENDSMLLPHERVGSDFSWLQEKTVAHTSTQKANELEDEESFLYGTESLPEDGGLIKVEKLNSACAGIPSNIALLSNIRSLTAQSPTLSSLSSADFVNVKNILKSLGASSDVGKTETQSPKERINTTPPPSGSISATATQNNPNVREALESLQSLIKATKEKRVKSEGSEKQKVDDEDRKNLKQAKISEMLALGKELEELLKEDGHAFLSPVIGFYCQKCEEFIGDLTSAEKHAAFHCSQSHQSSTSVHQSNEQQRGRDGYHGDDLRPQRASQEKTYLKDEMKKERILITVSGKSTSVMEMGRPIADQRNKTPKSERGSDRSRSPKTKQSKKKKEKKKKKKKGDV